MDSILTAAAQAAATNGNISGLRKCLQDGYVIDHQDDIAGWTLLHRAACYGHAEIAELLLECGASPSVDSDSGCQPLYLAALEGHDEMVQLLLRAGAEVNTVDQFGFTPLREATRAGHLRVVKSFYKRTPLLTRQTSINVHHYT
jgi:ankyrin repeat protein